MVGGHWALSQGGDVALGAVAEQVRAGASRCEQVRAGAHLLMCVCVALATEAESD